MKDETPARIDKILEDDKNLDKAGKTDDKTIEALKEFFNNRTKDTK